MRRRLEQKYSALCPYGRERLDRLVKRDMGIITSVAVAATALLLIWNSAFVMTSVIYVAGLILFSAFLLFHEISAKRIRDTEDVLYRELIEYIAVVKHLFQSEKNVANAIIEAAENFGEEIKFHAAKLYQILSEGARKEKIREYVIFTKYNRYLKLFLVQAYEASEKGDVMLNEEVTLFSENMEHLRMVVMEELYHRKKKRHEYAGYLFVTVAPVFFLPVLRQWGLSFAPELASFYMGAGRLIEIIALSVTYVLYSFIRMAKEVSFFEEEEAALYINRWYRNRLLQEQAEHEIRQFQSVLLMERYLTDNTIPELLEDMEIFSRLFRQELRTCINSYAAGPEQALQRLKEEGSKIHPAFCELADGFLAVDEVGIRKAFAEVGNNRDRLEKMSRLEAEIQLEKRKDGMDFLSRIPMVITLGGYFIAPFFVISLQGVFEVFSILNEMQI